MQVEGTHVLVTGAAKRVGRAIAERFLARGAKVSGHYYRSKAEISTLGSTKTVRPIQGDLRQVDDCRRVVREAVAGHGPLDVIVNSASDFYPTPTLDCDEKAWDDLMSINVKGPFFLCQEAGRTMVARGGVIINIADVNIERVIRNHVPYLAAKAGLALVTRALAKEWAPRVRVNSVSPGAVCLPERYTEHEKERSISRNLFKRVGSAEDIAASVLFLVENDYITGFDLKVDGGRAIF